MGFDAAMECAARPVDRGFADGGMRACPYRLDARSVGGSDEGPKQNQRKCEAHHEGYAEKPEHA